MTLEAILDMVYPVQKEHRKCVFKMQALEEKRSKLRKAIEAYKLGDVVDFAPMSMKIDIQAIIDKVDRERHN